MTEPNYGIEVRIMFTDGTGTVYRTPNFDELNFFWRNVEKAMVDEINVVAVPYERT